MEIQRLTTLIGDLENCLDRIFITGVGTVSEADIQALRQLAQECRGYGLALGVETLEKMADQWEQKRHNLTSDSKGLVRNLCVLDVYLSVIRSRLELMAVADAQKGITAEKQST